LPLFHASSNATHYKDCVGTLDARDAEKNCGAA
jgi:hypothetical protein